MIIILSYTISYPVIQQYLQIQQHSIVVLKLENYQKQKKLLDMRERTKPQENCLGLPRTQVGSSPV